MPSTNSPVDHLLRGSIPPEILAVLDAPPNADTSSGVTPFAPEEVRDESRPPVLEPIHLKDGEALPAAMLVPCRGFGKDQDGLTIIHGIIQHIAIDSVGVCFTFCVAAVFVGGNGTMQVDLSLVGPGPTPPIHLPSVDVALNLDSKGFLFHTIESWPIRESGMHHLVLRANGHKIADYPLPVFPRSVK